MALIWDEIIFFPMLENQLEYNGLILWFIQWACVQHERKDLSLFLPCFGKMLAFDFGFSIGVT